MAGGAVRDPDAMVSVRLLNLPLDLHARAREASDGLEREFMLIHHGRESAQSQVPGRLLALVDALRGRFARFAESTYEEMDAALARGHKRMDVTFTVPADAAPAAEQLDSMLDQADEYCRSGDLLTLATPEDLVAYRRWLLGEFVRQIAGDAPRPWDDEVQGPAT